jgi:hypothetical protein
MIDRPELWRSRRARWLVWVRSWPRGRYWRGSPVLHWDTLGLDALGEDQQAQGWRAWVSAHAHGSTPRTSATPRTQRSPASTTTSVNRSSRRCAGRAATLTRKRGPEPSGARHRRTGCAREDCSAADQSSPPERPPKNRHRALPPRRVDRPRRPRPEPAPGGPPATACL